ncbi:MAG: hypothetical protein RRY22_06065 [Bacilli bacterium]
MLKKLFPILIVGTIFTSCADETLTQQTPEEIAFDQSQSNRASQDVIDGRLQEIKIWQAHTLIKSFGMNHISF